MSTVKTYSLRLSGEKHLTTNFQVKEFACHDGSDKVLICQETVDILQAVRDYFGKPVYINSGYRTPEYNARPSVGGAKNSQHVKGTAADIRVEDVPSWAVAGYLEDYYPKHGIGLYENFVHIDSRGYKVYWKNKGSNVVSSFKIGSGYTVYKAKPIILPPKEEPKEEDMTDKQIYEAVQRHAKTLPVPEWARKSFQEAIDAGITDGSEPCALIPRYQAAIMALRASKK